MGDARKGNPGDKVVAQFSRWDPPAKIPTCKILRVLGPGGEAQTDHLGILAKFGLSAKFPHKVEEEAKAVANSLTKADLKHRVDYRNIFTITIDPLDARDFDDALSLKSINDDIWEVGVHIADVSHYVQENSNLDTHAKERGNSIYFPNFVIPMLPEKLSNDLCSLKENKLRLTLSVEIILDSEGNKLSHKFFKSTIKSAKRFTYNDRTFN